ncbi:MAG: hypothetical protein WCX84_09265 [Syntrophales bacterium]|jgi:hypothetical protein|nr:hypothetical protein [Syntrophales bacterium]NLN59114.1 hypothetical protein [Deltaproteobacteria bacterium]
MVRPVDAQQSILQSHAMEKVQNVQQQHGDMQQRYFNLQLQEERRLQKERVKDLEKKDAPVIRDSFRHEGKKRETRDGHEPEEQDLPPAEHPEDEPVPGSHIDIKA